MWLLLLLVVVGVGAVEEEVYSATLDQVLDVELMFSASWFPKEKKNMGNIDKEDHGVTAKNVTVLPFTRTLEREGPALVQLSTHPLTYSYNYTIVMKDIYVTAQELKLSGWKSSKHNVTIHIVHVPIHIHEKKTYFNTTDSSVVGNARVGELVVRDDHDDISEPFNRILLPLVNKRMAYLDEKRSGDKYCDLLCTHLFPPNLNINLNSV